MATYYDGLKDFFEKNDFSPLASSAQLVYLHLLQLNNRHGNSGFVQISDRELERLTSLNKNTITKAKRTLKNCKWIDFHTEPDKPHRGTSYTLTFFKVGQTIGQTVGQTIGQSIIQNIGQSVGQPLSNTPILSMDKDLRLETKTEKSISYLSIACANSQELDNIIDYWEQTLKGGRLSIEHQSEIEVWLEKYGVAWVKATMKEASNANGNPNGLNFKLLKGVVNRKLKSATSTFTRGGEKVEQPTDPRAKWAYSD